MRPEKRIREMEAALNRLNADLRKTDALKDLLREAAQDAALLNTYYGSDEWWSDVLADENGELPEDLNRGVLSQDALWNVLEEYRECMAEIRQLSSGLNETEH